MQKEPLPGPPPPGDVKGFKARLAGPACDVFRWVVSFGKGSGRADAAGQPLTLEVEFPRNYPFSAPHVTCRQFALFVPRFVPDWTPRMTVRTLLTAVMAKLEKVPFPANHVDLGRNSPDEVCAQASCRGGG